MTARAEGGCGSQIEHYLPRMERRQRGGLPQPKERHQVLWQSIQLVGFIEITDHRIAG
jgi:hypothetical protein